MACPIEPAHENTAMVTELGYISAIVRYPVKSMAGERLESATLGWHGMDGDRRFAFRRLDDHSSFPWLTASRLPELLLYQPIRRRDAPGELLPTHIRTPHGREIELQDSELVEEIAARYQGPVELMQLKHGIFDDADVSVITLETIRGIMGVSGHDLDFRRFRPNVVIDFKNASPFEEDRWVGGVLEFGDHGTGPAVSVTMRDKRCVMINLDPDTAVASAEIMKTAVRLNDNYAGVYGTVIRTGELRVGQTVSLRK
jgi:uncharacterized protein YcbX